MRIAPRRNPRGRLRTNSSSFSSYLGSLWENSWKLWRAMKRVSADIYLLEAPFPAIKSLVAVGLGRPGSLAALDIGDYWLESDWYPYQRFLDHAVRTSSRYVDKISVVNPELKERLIGNVSRSGQDALREEILVLPNGVDLTLFAPGKTSNGGLPLPSKEKTAIYVGAMTRDHGCEALPWIVRATCQIDSEIRFIFVGGGEYLGELRARLYQETNDGRVLFVGRVPYSSVRDYIACARVGIFLKPSSYRTAGTYYPLKVLEYMAMECPPLAEATPQLNHLIIDGRNGRLVCMENLPETIVEMLGSPGRLKHLGRNARQSVTPFSWDSLAKKLLHFWVS